jgi:hypothetical protein
MKTSVHITLDKEDIETVLKALVERRTGQPVVECWQEIVALKGGGAALNCYHFHCSYVETKETTKKEVKTDGEIHPLHVTLMAKEQQGKV